MSKVVNDIIANEKTSPLMKIWGLMRYIERLEAKIKKYENGPYYCSDCGNKPGQEHNYRCKYADVKDVNNE